MERGTWLWVPASTAKPLEALSRETGKDLAKLLLLALECGIVDLLTLDAEERRRIAGQS